MRAYKFGLFILSLLTLGAVGSATTILSISLSGSSFLDEKVSNIHFNAGGNDFGGMILWQDTYGETKTLQISGQNTTGDCRLRVEGLYYNAERGERLRPLDEKTRARFFASELNADDLAGGLYTDCTGAVLTADPRSMGVYGYLTHTYKNKTYGLIAGLKYTLSANSAGSPQSPGAFAPTFQRYANRRPFGLIYDYNGGLGFVGCQLSGLTSGIVNTLNASGVNAYFTGELTNNPEPIGALSELNCTGASTTNSLLLLMIQGLIGMSTESSAGGLLGNEANAKQQYFSSVNLNQASLINTAKQRAEELCRGKWGTDSGEIYCLREGKAYNVDQIQDKIVIMQNGDLTLKGKMEADTAPLNIFIDGGKLILKMDGEIQPFDKNGYPGGSVYTGIYLKGNFIINGIMVGSGGQVANQTFIHGKFTSLNTYAEPSSQRMTQLQSVLGTTVNSAEVDLREVFSRRCEWGSTTDDTGACPTTGDFTNSPLIIINQNYPSKLVQ